MAYDIKLADRVRAELATRTHLHVEEKKMFRGLTFMVNGKMCVSVGGENLMCRFDPALQSEVEEKVGFQTMRMKGRVYSGFCYVAPEGFKTAANFRYWIELCLAFNTRAKASTKLANAEKIYFADRTALRTWFVKNHTKLEAFWLVYDKTKDGKRRLTTDDIVEESLCFGFIDGQLRKVSATQASIYVSRRKPKSEWSKRNKDKVAVLTHKKLMHAAGLDAVKRAQENGSWSKIDGSENHVMPEDFAKILGKKTAWRKHFESLAPSTRKMFLHRLQSAKTPATRAKRLEFLTQLLEVKMQPSELRLAFTKGVIPQR